MENKILVVDDEERVANFLKTCLKMAGYEVHAARTAEEAMEVIRQERIEVFFLDIQLAGNVNGVELCRQIKAKLPVYCIYALTGHASLYDVRICREAGFDDYFTKPVAIDLIVKAANDAFDKLERWKRQ